MANAAYHEEVARQTVNNSWKNIAFYNMDKLCGFLGGFVILCVFFCFCFRIVDANNIVKS